MQVHYGRDRFTTSMKQGPPTLYNVPVRMAPGQRIRQITLVVLDHQRHVVDGQVHLGEVIAQVLQ